MSQAGVLVSHQVVLQYHGVSFAYGENLAVENVSLSLETGQFVGLIGPNGSGKSTLVRLAIGLLHPVEGEVRIFGQPVCEFRDWARVGFVPQVSGMRADFPATVEEVVASGRVARRGLLRRLNGEDSAAVESALGQVDIADLRGRLIGQLSGGQRQRVMLARALAGKPELLLLDEPTAGVDVGTKLQLLRLLRTLCDEANIAVVYVSHDLESLRPFLDGIALLNRRLLFFGPIRELDERKDVQRELVEASVAAEHPERGGMAP